MQTASIGGVAGRVGDEPWGATLASITHRRLTGQLQLRGDDAKLYRIAFVDGRVVGASSPLAADSIVRIALTNHLISSSQVALVAKRLTLAPNRDEVDVVSETVRLSVEHVVKLRRRAMIQRAARTFGIDHGEYRLDPEITLPQINGIDVDVRAVIALGSRMNLSDYRLISDLRRLGTRFRLRTTCELAPFELLPELVPILESLRDGTTLAELDAHHRGIEPRVAQSVLYALITGDACEVLETIPASAPPRFRPPSASITELTSRVRTTNWPKPRAASSEVASPVSRVPAVVSKPPAKLADEAFQRGVMAMRRDDVQEAVLELVQATELQPQDVDYAAMLAWVRFCAAPNKQAIADDTRRLLERAVNRSPNPMMSRFYLGRVERMLGRVREALHHFREVIEIEPGHADAAAEIRMLEPRVASDRRR